MLKTRRGIVGLGAALTLGGSSAARAITYSRPEYWLYFDHASAVLSPEMTQAIFEMKGRFDGWVEDTRQPARYVLTGSTDGAEEAVGYRDLIGRRVQAVTKALTALGVDPAFVTVSERIPGQFPFFKKGETQPLARAVFMGLP